MWGDVPKVHFVPSVIKNHMFWKGWHMVQQFMQFLILIICMNKLIVFLAFTSIHLCTEEHQTCNASEQLHMLQILFWDDFQNYRKSTKSKVKSVQIKGLSKIKLPTWAITPYLKTFLRVCWSKFDSHGHLGQVGHLDWQIDCYDLIKQVVFNDYSQTNWL